MDWKTHIIADTSVLAGKPIVKGTRLSVDFILSLFAEGWTEQQVLDNYPQITLESLLLIKPNLEPLSRSDLARTGSLIRSRYPGNISAPRHHSRSRFT